jgi:hypothetical protein
MSTWCTYPITASIRLAINHTLQQPLLATQTPAVVTTTCLDYLQHSHTRTMRPSTASPICLCAYFQRILGVPPSPLAHLAEAAARTARDSNIGSGNHEMSTRLSALAYPNGDTPIHGLTDVPLRLLPTDIGCGALAPRSQTTHGNTRCSRLKPRHWRLWKSLIRRVGVNFQRCLWKSRGGCGFPEGTRRKTQAPPFLCT